MLPSLVRQPINERHSQDAFKEVECKVFNSKALIIQIAKEARQDQPAYCEQKCQTSQLARGAPKSGAESSKVATNRHFADFSWKQRMSTNLDLQ
jgi:hypothetical protein